ncbi:MAG: preprotein translocase subunit SecG [Spirochaetaceae bacterium]|jgi:preprotein translocase subunit SecG|nr:preprotein translocase subunit SecG [Spirochaetaceae bacterium]
MGILASILLVLFIIVSILLVLLVLVQDEEGDSLGGIFAGGSSSAFGSRSGTVLTRITSVLGALFLVLSFGLALTNRTSDATGVENAARQQSNTNIDNTWWQEEVVAPTTAPETITVPDGSSEPEPPQTNEAPVPQTSEAVILETSESTTPNTLQDNIEQ